MLPMSRHRPVARLASAAALPCLLIVGAAPAVLGAQEKSRAGAASHDARWTAVSRELGRDGEVEDGYFRVNFPRSDLTVRIGDHILAPAFELTTYMAFVPTTGGRVMVMGEIVLREDELRAVLQEARTQGIEMAAIHNHLVGEVPRMMYVHVMASGEPAAVARKLRAIIARSATPTGRPLEAAKGSPSAWASEIAALGAPDELEGETAEWVFPRREPITEGGVNVKSTGALETASEVVFQRLSSGKAATTGEMFLLGSEVTPVTQALAAGAIQVTAIHTHMLHESPRMFWLHWYGTGDPAALARTIRAAVGQTNSVTVRGNAHR
jgi:hypothetical protein